MKRIGLLSLTTLLLAGLALTGAAFARAQDQGTAQEQHHPEEKSLQAAAAAGLEFERLRRDMSDPAIECTIARNRALAAELTIDGTPAFVVADRVVPGAVDRATLEGLIAEARGRR